MALFIDYSEEPYFFEGKSITNFVLSKFIIDLVSLVTLSTMLYFYYDLTLNDLLRSFVCIVLVISS